MSKENPENVDDRPGPSTGRNEEDEDDEDGPPTDNWDLWAKIHSNRDIRLKLLCRDPDDRTPSGSTSVVVRKLPLDATKEQISSLFHKAGGIKSIYFPKVAPHFTTKYCFITFYDFRQAERAQKFFDGYQWGRDRLQVVSYDACYKYRQALVGPKVARTQRDDEQGTSIVFNAIRQAEAQSESRKTRFQKLAATQSTPAFNPNKSGGGLAPSINGSGSLQSLFHSDDADSDESCSELKKGMAEFQQMSTMNSTIALEAQLDHYLYRECDTIDDVLLDSEIGFLNWLEGRLKFAGPLHYTDRMICSAIMKTPAPIQTMFTWLHGALRCLSDGKRFKVVGPFVCLPSHDWCAEDKCIALGFPIDEWYKEEWEPMPPNQIFTTKALIKYMRAMLERFGPLQLNDIKLQQLALFLPNFAIQRWVNYAEKSGDQADNENNPLARTNRLLSELRRCKEFRIVEGVIFSPRAHYEILLLKSAMVSNSGGEPGMPGPST